jgi:acyl-CoA carboxylase subunit beta
MTNTLHAATKAPRPDWTACPNCGWLIYHKRLSRNLHVCPECDHHLRMGARERIDLLVDPGSFTELSFSPMPGDPLAFVDIRDYRARLSDARAKSGETEAVIAGQAFLGGRRIVLAVMDFAFLGGSMGLEVGRRISGATEAALEARVPLVVVCASGGARMQEGVFSLLQMARTAQAFARLHEAGVLSVCVLTDPTYGGVSASFANLGAVVVAERGAHVGFAGPRVVQETIRAELPQGFQTAEFLLEHGLVDRVESRGDLRPLLIRLVVAHSGGDNEGRVRLAEPEVAPPAIDRTISRDAWETVQTARNIDRPTMLEYLSYAFDDFVELHGDRTYSDDPAIVGGIARIAHRSVVVLGHQKGHTVGDLVARNFGMPHPEGYRKAIRLMQHAERFGFPVVTLVDTPGAYPGPDAEQRGQSIAIADAIMMSTQLRVPVVSVITGEGGSGGALALCTSDRLLMLENAFLSVISPEGCAAILWRTASSAPAAARALQLGTRHLLDSGVATSVIAEPEGGAQADPMACAISLRAALLQELDELSQLTPAELLALRHQRFSRLGSADPSSAPEHGRYRQD